MPIAPMQTESRRSSSDGSSSSDSESSNDELNNECVTAVNDSIEPVASTSRSTANTPLSTLGLTSNTNPIQSLDCEDNNSSNKGRKRKSTPNTWIRNKAKILRNSGSLATNSILPFSNRKRINVRIVHHTVMPQKTIRKN
ncbi:uncharacterized protein LOC113507954 [Trichoplusia ni]|uniref:Uncharacterized protein LOC113507954 n=1 Tax=Trichoplusia ni TaxID=7111 RepID=A0A7E5X2M1_TRINI|nr:uncharacterized protein LOC113507954 [Trichoplusia ni]